MSDFENISPELAASIQRCIDDSPAVAKYRSDIREMNAALTEALLCGVSTQEYDALVKQWRKRIEKSLQESYDEFFLLLESDLFIDNGDV